MADSTLTVSPYAYFKTRFYVNENRILQFREVYRRLSKIDHFDGHQIDQRALLDAAQELGIQSDTYEYQQLLQECVQYENEDDTFGCINLRRPDSRSLPRLPSLPSTTAPSTEQPRLKPEVKVDLADNASTNLKEIQCVLTLKRREKIVDDFLYNQLLRVVKETGANG